ncbi:alpha/beta hydrolase [Pseudoflavitalea sp. G-6-1-2]|uniref:alpha/beta hydrolase family protein n=1 Tax=Pseudoflavitalea sp. G-6-1-2 TaxID=2728841 RepID=UPI00146B4323|nr:alpha/beta family hydrolase [Pseudoflavitalea sp. G-6-1-2]NML22560.1 alpha/beta hydrolase [Pseudoflavitalea sp. G-6-1-2]
MPTKSISISVSPEIGKVSAILVAPSKPTCILTLAHGAGAGMQHVFMENLSAALAAAGIATLRFNFPFAEQQKKRPDSPAVAHKTIEAAIDKAIALYPELPVFAAGKSFGGRMSSQYLSANPRKDVKGIIFFGFPLHQPGKPGIDRAEHLQQVKVPMLFLQGTRDTLANIDMMEEVCDGLKKATLVKFEGADHSFKAGKKEMIPLLVEATQKWLAKKTKNL